MPNLYVVSGSQGQYFIMDEDMEAPDQVEQLDGAIVKRKRVEEGNVDINSKPASKATGKPVLNTRALRSVLKGGVLLNTCTAPRHISNCS